MLPEDRGDDLSRALKEHIKKEKQGIDQIEEDNTREWQAAHNRIDIIVKEQGEDEKRHESAEMQLLQEIYARRLAKLEEIRKKIKEKRDSRGSDSNEKSLH